MTDERAAELKAKADVSCREAQEMEREYGGYWRPTPISVRATEMLDLLAARAQVSQLTKRVAELEAEKLKTKQE